MKIIAFYIVLAFIALVALISIIGDLHDR